MYIIIGGFERWFNLTVVNISEDDADDYTCVGVNAGRTNHNISSVCNSIYHSLHETFYIKETGNAFCSSFTTSNECYFVVGGVSEQNVSLTFDQPKERFKQM